MFDHVFAADAEWNLFALEIALKATLLLLFAAAVAMLSYRSSAAVRHRVWALASGGLLLLPLIQLAGPGFPWRVIPEHWHAATARCKKWKAL